MSIDLDKLWCLPVDVATTPRNGEAIVDGWWVMHPEQGIVLFTRRGTTTASKRPRWCSPQYNHNKVITDHFVESMYPFAFVQQLPVVYLRCSSENGFYLPEQAVPCQALADTLTKEGS